MTFLCLTLTPLFCKKLAGDVRWPLPSPICRLARALSDLHGVWCPATGLYPPRAGSFWCVDLLLIVNAWNDTNEKPGSAYAFGGQRRSRGVTHTGSTAPPQRGGAEFSGFTSPGRTGARNRSGPRAKRARLSASLVRGWIFGCLRASEKSLYIRHGPNMLLTGTGSVFPRVRLDLMAWKLAYLFARCCSPAKSERFLPRRNGTGGMDVRQVSF